MPEGGAFRYCIGGFDAADSIDLNAAKAICKRRGDDKLYIKQMYWIPQAVLDQQEERGDRREPGRRAVQLMGVAGLDAYLRRSARE